MAKFVFEKLPPHWLFVPSKREVRELLARLGVDVRLVEFYGTGYGRQSDRLSLGFVESRVVEGGWCFYLHLWGVREAVAGPVQAELAVSASAAIERYIRGCVDQSPADVIKPAQLYLSFRVEPEGVRSGCSVRVVGKRSFTTRRWWDREPTS
jgi:hypothetical protein